MGNYLEGTIRCFKPDNTDEELYLEADAEYAGMSLEDLLERARDHFGQDVDLSRIELHAKNIHTRCLGLDYHDPTDWTDFIILTLKPEASE